MAASVRLTWNGEGIEVEEGTFLIEAAKKAGVELPHFCYHPKLKYDANCRMCIVQVEKMPKLQTACSTLAMEGMVVRSDTDRVKEAQDGVMAFLLGNHPLDCPECDQGGECQLQDFAHRHSPTSGNFAEPKRVFEKEYFGPLIEKEMNRCVSCLRCVRYCDEVIGSNALGSIDRGSITEIGGFAHHPLDCEFCGGCIQICPVGALTSRASMYDYRPWQVKKTDTICTYCGDGCQITLETIDDKVVRASSKMGVGRNEGDLCAKGFFGYGFINHKERLIRPMVLQKGRLQPVTWEWALKDATKQLQAIKEQYGPEAIGGIIGGHCTNESIHLFQRLMRDVVGTPHVHTGAQDGFINASQALISVFGTTRLLRYEDIVNADVILSFAGDMTETNPICAIKVKEAVRKGKAKLIAIDSFTSQGDTYKSHLPHIAHRHLQINPGTEGWVIIGLIKIIAERAVPNRLIPAGYIAWMKQSTASISFETIEEISGISRAGIEEIACLYAEANASVLIVGRAIIKAKEGFGNMMNIADLALLAGQVAKEGAGILALSDTCNDAYAEDERPGRVAAGENSDGLSAEDQGSVVDAVGRGKIRALYVVGANPFRAFPQKKMQEAFANLELLICQDLFLTETAAHATIVLPAASFAEQEGHYTSQEGEIQKVRKAIDPIGNARPDWAIFESISEKMGKPFGYKNAGEIWKGAAAEIPVEWLTPSLEGITSQIAAYCDQPRTFVKPTRPPVKDGASFHLRMGPTLFQSGKLSGYSDGLNVISPKYAVFIHPDDAERIGVAEGEVVEMSPDPADLAHTAIQIPIAFSKRVAPGTLFLPEHSPLALDIKRGLPFEIDPVTHVTYSHDGVVKISKM